MVVEFRVENHYVQRGYLRRWARSVGRVWTYRTLVSRERVREWQLQSLRSVASHEHLYAQYSYGASADAVERWLAARVEAPASSVLDKIHQELKLRPSDWDDLLRFFAATRVRTPAYLMRRRAQWDQQMPEVIDSSLRRATELLGRGQLLPVRGPDDDAQVRIESPFRVRISENSSGAGGLVEAQVLLARPIREDDRDVSAIA